MLEEIGTTRWPRLPCRRAAATARLYAPQRRSARRPACGRRRNRHGYIHKEPDKPEELLFTFGEQAYTCKVSGYTDTDDLRKTLFSVDLTEEYKQLYPDAGVTQVIRKEYTSHPY
ncbi:MAG: hypothetical protein ACLRM8_03320 [Alistipes sp.]